MQKGDSEGSGNVKRRKKPKKAAGQAKGRGKGASQAYGRHAASFMSAAALMSKQ